MSQRVLDILVRLTGAERVAAQLRSIDGEGRKSAAEIRKAFGEAVPVLGQLDQQVSSFVGVLKQLPPTAGLAGLAIAGLTMEVKLLSSAMRELDAASQRLGILTQTRSRLGGTGATLAELRRLQGLEGGTVSLADMARLSNAAATRGIDVETFREIVATADELATVTGRDLIPTIEQLNQAVGTGTVRAFASAGADVRQLIKEFGEGRLSVEETRIVMQRLRDQVDGSGDSVSDALNSAKTAAKDAWAVLGEVWVQNPAVITSVNAYAFAVNTVADAYANVITQVGEFYGWINKLLELSPGNAANGSGSAPYISATGAAQYQQMQSNPVFSEHGLAGAPQPGVLQSAVTRTPDVMLAAIADRERNRRGGGQRAVPYHQTRAFQALKAQLEAAGLESQAQWLLDSGLLDQNAAAEEQAMRWEAAARLGGGPRAHVTFSQSYLNRQMASRLREQMAGMTPFERAQHLAQRLGMAHDPFLSSPGRTSQLGRGGNAAALMDLYGSYQSGGIGGLVGTGAGMVFANTLSAASMLGAAGGPVGMLAGSLLGSLFQKHQRETIRGPIEVEDKRVADILGGLNSTMNEMLRLVTAGGADRLFADAARQAVAL